MIVIRDAIKWLQSPPAYRQVDGGAPGYCLKNVRTAFNVPALYRSASVASQHTTLRPGAKPGSAPRNRPYFWTGGSHGDGHIAITDGYTRLGRRLRVWTTDWPNPVTGHADGKWRRVRVDTITARWGLTPVGWGDSLNGVDINL
jgi:hypothetical protein